MRNVRNILEFLPTRLCNTAIYTSLTVLMGWVKKLKFRNISGTSYTLGHDYQG